MLARKPKSLVGLDIGSSAVKVVELHRRGKKFRLAAAGVDPLPVGTIVDGVIFDAGAVSDTVRRLFEKLRIKSRDVAVALSGGGVIAKRLSFPLMSDEELDESIRKEVLQHIPFESRDVCLDYQDLGDSFGDDRDGSRNVLLVVARRDRVEAFVSVVEQAGCVPNVVDVDVFALQNAYEINNGVNDFETVLLIDAGASATSLNVIRDGQSLFSRYLGIGGNAYSEALKKLDLELSVADSLKRGTPVGGVTYALAEPIIQPVTQSLIREVSKALDFSRAIGPIERIDRIVLSGGTSRVKGLPESLSEHFDVDVEMFDSLRGLTIEDDALSDDQWGDICPVAAVAVGLALRGQLER